MGRQVSVRFNTSEQFLRGPNGLLTQESTVSRLRLWAGVLRFAQSSETGLAVTASKIDEILGRSAGPEPTW